MDLGAIGELQAHTLLFELLAHPTNHQVDHTYDLGLRQLVEHDGFVDAVQELRTEVILERLVDLCLHPLVTHCFVVLGEAQVRLAQVTSTEVRGHDQHRVAEVNRTTLAVGQATLFEDLQQCVEDVGVCLFNFVEQHYREWLAAHSFGELTTLVVTDIPRG